MCNENNIRTLEWDSDNGEDIYVAKQDIISILKQHKVSISKVRYLFNKILDEIEDRNPITF
nr:MAG TPA: hypothetical protein [Caudoviricetes sp.]